jgi:CBS-domain-containing membrane protein
VKSVGELIESCSARFEEVPGDLTLQEALDRMGKASAEVLVVRCAEASPGLLSGRELTAWLAANGIDGWTGVPVRSAMMPEPARVEASTDLQTAVDRLSKGDHQYLVVMDSKKCAAVLSGLHLMAAVNRLMEDELENLGGYLSDLHEAGFD